MPSESPQEPLPREVVVLGGVSLAQDTGSEMLYPFLPTLITGVLGAPVVAVGIAEGLADASAAIMKLVAGRFAQPGERRRWIAVGYGLAVVGKAMVALAFVWPAVLLGRMVDRVGKGIRGTPRDALIADVCSAGQRGRAFGLHRSMDTTGAVIGPLLGLGVYHLFGERIRPTLLLALVPALISVILVALVRDVARQPRSETASVAGPERVPLPRPFWRVMVPLGVFALVNSTDALLLQRAHELGFDLTGVVLVYVLYNAVYALLGYPAGRVADRLSPRLVFAAGLLVFAFAYIGLGRAGSTTWVWILLPVYGAFTALTDGVGKAWISGLVDREQRTWALGVHGGWMGIGTLVAGLWSGLAWSGSGAVPLTISGVVAAVVAAWLLVGTRHLI